MHLSIEDDASDVESKATIAGLVASLYVAAYFVVLLQPFVLIVSLPGSVGWAGLPLLGLLALVLAPRDRLVRVPVSVPILALAVWSAASLAWSSSFGESFFAIRTEIPSLILLCLVVGSMARGRVIRTLLWVFAGVGVWSLASSLTMATSQVAFVGDGLDQAIQEGWRGTFLHKNLLGVFALLGLTTTLAFVRHRGVKSAMLGLFVVLVLGTRSATAASGLVVVGVVWSWLTWFGGIHNPRSRALAALASVVLLAAAVASALALLPILVGLYGKDLTFSGRTDIWAASIDTIRQRPLLGYGTGRVWQDRFDPLTADLHRRIGFRAAHAHNGVLDVLLAVGIVGLTLYFLVLVSTTRLAISALRTSGAAYGRWAVYSMSAIVIMGLSEPLFEGAALGFLAIMWTVLAGFINARSRPPLAESSRSAANSALDVTQPPLGGGPPVRRDLLAAFPSGSIRPPLRSHQDGKSVGDIVE